MCLLLLLLEFVQCQLGFTLNYFEKLLEIAFGYNVRLLDIIFQLDIISYQSN